MKDTSTNNHKVRRPRSRSTQRRPQEKPPTHKDDDAGADRRAGDDAESDANSDLEENSDRRRRKDAERSSRGARTGDSSSSETEGNGIGGGGGSSTASGNNAPSSLTKKSAVKKPRSIRLNLMVASAVALLSLTMPWLMLSSDSHNYGSLGPSDAGYFYVVREFSDVLPSILQPATTGESFQAYVRLTLFAHPDGLVLSWVLLLMGGVFGLLGWTKTTYLVLVGLSFFVGSIAYELPAPGIRPGFWLACVAACILVLDVWDQVVDSRQRRNFKRMALNARQEASRMDRKERKERKEAVRRERRRKLTQAD